MILARLVCPILASYVAVSVSVSGSVATFVVSLSGVSAVFCCDCTLHAFGSQTGTCAVRAS